MNRTLLIQPNVSIIDVRRTDEFQEAHYPGALHIPLDEVPQRIDEFREMSAPIILYCRTGNRSGQALEILKAAGIKDLYNGGGLEDMLRYRMENEMDDMGIEDIFQ
jgi:phage shock protein E